MNELTVRLIIVGIVVTSILWFVIGYTSGKRDIRCEAIKAGAAYYQSNTNTGEAVFTWKKGCE